MLISSATIPKQPPSTSGALFKFLVLWDVHCRAESSVYAVGIPVFFLIMTLPASQERHGPSFRAFYWLTSCADTGSECVIMNNGPNNDFNVARENATDHATQT